MLVRIYTDGSARGNPDGPGGYGAVLKYVDPKGALHEREFSQGYVRTTNNRMELMAAIVHHGADRQVRSCFHILLLPLLMHNVYNAVLPKKMSLHDHFHDRSAKGHVPRL